MYMYVYVYVSLSLSIYIYIYMYRRGEATCNANCIGLVKLTGAKNGFLALEAKQQVMYPSLLWGLFGLRISYLDIYYVCLTTSFHFQLFHF